MLFGANDSDIKVDSDAAFDINGNSRCSLYHYVINGGTKFTYEGEYVHCRGEAWGNGKTVNEGMPAKISLPSKATATKCWALDERGERKAPVPVSADAEGRAVVEIGLGYKTVWYEVDVGV